MVMDEFCIAIIIDKLLKDKLKSSSEPTIMACSELLLVST
ncbi:protein of unknown function [Lactiplantibacillus plantarum]